MPIRNPFARRPGSAIVSDENAIPEQDPSCPGFERVDTVGSKASSVLSIRSAKSQDNGEYKMSGMSPGRRRPSEPKIADPSHQLSTTAVSIFLYVPLRFE